jgi:heterogeneous nuclear ribonucleoprotein L
MMPKKRQALIEFADIAGAINCVNEASRSVIIIGGSPAYLNYSSSQKIIRPGLEF